MASEEGVNFLTNPIFYKIRHVGNAGKASAKAASNRLKRVKESNTIINKRFIAMSGGDITSGVDERRVRKMARQRMRRLSVKMKNK